MNRKHMFAAIPAMLLAVAAWPVASYAAPGNPGGNGSGGGPSSQPCKTTGNLALGDPSPSNYSYTLGQSGSQSGFVPVTMPSANLVNCDATQPKEFGQTGKTFINMTMAVQSVSDLDGNEVDSGTVEAIKNGFSIGYSGDLRPGEGGHIPFTFANSHAVPAGGYAIHFKTDSGGVTNDANSKGFVLTANAPSPGDSLPPDVSITHPSGNPKLIVNGSLNIGFAANDPLENGAGTGIHSMGARVTSSRAALDEDVSSLLTSTAGLPVAAGLDVAASATLPVNQVGSYTVTVEAKDGCAVVGAATNCDGAAIDHVGSAGAAYTVGVNVQCLPPISITNRQFNGGSTVPVKWVFTDANGAFLPAYDSVKATIAGPGGVAAYAGEGASNIRWELDSEGNATQYIVNFPIPSTLTTSTTYVATFSVKDVDGVYAAQGVCSFLANPAKGGKVK